MRYDVLQIHGVRLNIAAPETEAEAKKGLLDLSFLPDDQGLSYRPAPVLHTFGMTMPIDILWLDPDGTIACFDENVPADQVIAPRTAWAVEVAGGWVGRNL